MWRDGGWPFTHEGPAFFHRTLIYAQHLAAGDLFPIWSSEDVFGFGSPMPLLYHKQFYLLAAPIALATGSLKLADALALWLMLVCGAAGMYACARVLGARRLASAVAGVSLIAANYTVTDWLVRGNVAELSAMMLVPWLLYFLIVGRQGNQIPAGAGVLLALVAYAHSVLAFFSGVIFAVAMVILAATNGADRRLLLPRAWWRPVVLASALVTPLALLTRVFSPAYDFSRILTPPFRPIDQFRPLSMYLWDTTWAFGQTVAGYTRQLDIPMMTLGVAVAGFAGWRGWTHQPSIGRARLRALALPFVVGLLALLLQLPTTNAIYEAIPGAAYIQFPWRLLALITPCLILCAVVAADLVLVDPVRLVVLAAAGAWMVAGSGALVPIHDPRYPQTEWSRLPPQSFSGFREYEPAAALPIGESRARLDAAWREAGCQVTRREPGLETLNVQFDVVCGATTPLVLPVYSSPVHSVRIGAETRTVPCLAVEQLPALCGVVVPGGASLVTVRMPTVGRAFRAIIGS